MNIIAGLARGVELIVPEGVPVRPTSGRVRKALFDSLGDLSGAHVLDLFSGSGALALEALSRGAASAVMVELSENHIRFIEKNLERLRNTGVSAPARIIQGDATHSETYLARLKTVPDLIFADPPYPISSEAFNTLMSSDYFLKTLSGSRLIWELPDTPGAAGSFLDAGRKLQNMNLRRYAGTMFLTGIIPPAE